MKPCALLLTVAVLVAVVLPVKAQDQIIEEKGLKPFGTYEGGNFDSISMNNGSLTLHIPFWSYPQRGGKLRVNYFIRFNSNPWELGGFCINPLGCTRSWHWIGNCGPGTLNCMGGPLEIRLDQAMHLQTKSVRIEGYGDVNSYSAVTESGNIIQLARTGAPETIYRSFDGSGVLYDKSAGFYDRDGIASGTLDPNGNFITTFDGTVVTSVTDTLGRSIPNTVTATPAELAQCDSTPLPVTSASTWVLPAFNGGTARIIFCMVTFHLHRDAFDPGNGDPDFDANKSFVQSIILPNGTKWKFEYQVNEGNVTKVTLPTGGSISYTYGGGVANCTDNRPVGVLQRILDAGDGTPARTWTYTWTSGSLPDVVTDPMGNDTTYDMGGHSACTRYEQVVKTYLGSQATGTLLKTVQTTYRITPTISPYSAENPGGVFPATVTTSYPIDASNSVTMKTVKNYDGPANEGQFTFYALDPRSSTPYTGLLGNVFNVKDYDYATNASPTVVLRETVNAYKFSLDSNYKNNNLIDLLASVRVNNGSGAQVALTSYTYDDYTAPYTLQASGINTQHTNPAAGKPRGNVTSVSRWLNTTGANLLSRTVYFDTGVPYQTIDPGLHTTTYSYSSTFAGAYPTQVQLPDTHAPTLASHITLSNYDFNTGLAIQATDENSRNTNFSYDVLNRPDLITYPDGGQVDFSYNDALPSATSPSVTISQKITSTVDSTKIYIVDGLGRLIHTQHTSDQEGTVFVDTTYDGLGRKASVTNPYRSPTGESTNGVTQYLYDTLGRITTLTQADNTPVLTVYPGNCTLATDEAGRKRKSCSDGLGRITQVNEDPTGVNYLTSYQYDTLGNLLCSEQHGTVSSASGCGGSSDVGSLWRVRRFTYDSLSRLQTAKNPETGTATSYGTVSYTYDADGNVLTKIAPAANQTGATMTTTTYSYDEIHRLKSKSYSGGTVTTASVSYGYDGGTLSGCTTPPPVPSPVDANPKPYRTSMCDGGGASSWTHDEMGRILKDRRINVGTASPTKLFTYTYNIDGSLFKLQYPSGRTITYTVGGAGRTLSAQDTANAINYVTTATYAPHGAPSGFTNQANIKGRFTYNPRLQPRDLFYGTNGTIPTLDGTCPGSNPGNIMHHVYHFGLGTNDNGNVQSIDNCSVPSRTATYTYDNLNRIASGYSAGSQWGNTYVIDAWGNLTNKNAITGKTAENLAATATWKNQLGTIGHSYDAAGNLTNDGLGHSFTYDAENRIVSVAGTPGWTYTHDGDGRRVKKCSSCSTASGGTMYYQGTGADNIVESNLGGSVTFEYVFFNGKRIARRDTSTNPPFYYFSDHLGSTAVATDFAGVTKDDSDYFPYGGEVSYTNLLPQNYKFNGKHLDTETNLHYYGARYYGSAIGRFVTPDWSDKPTTVPYASFGNPQSLNLYSYVNNNPTTTGDPDGHCGDVRDGACDGSVGGAGKIVDSSSGQNSSAGHSAHNKYGRQPDGSYKADPAKVQQAIDAKKPIGNGQCVAACSALTQVTPHTDSWTPGRSVLELNDTTDIGLAVASFGADKKFKQPDSDQNSAVYMGHDPKTGKIMVVDQWPPPNAKQYNAPFKHPLENYGPTSNGPTGRIENNAYHYSVIVVP